MQLATLQPPAETRRSTGHGLAELVLERRAGRTRLTRSRTRPPLIVQQALYPDESMPDMAYVFLANPTGGLLDGDCQEVRVEVGCGAKAHITTQSATKIFTMDQSSAEQHVELNVAAGGYLEYLPDPLIPFRNAALQQDIAITVEPGSALLWWDVVTPGRVAMGESFQYRRLSNRLAVYRDSGRPVYREAFDLVPGESDPIGVGLLGPVTNNDPSEHDGRTLGSMLILCNATDTRRILELLRAILTDCAMTQAGISILPDGNGLGVKVIGEDCAAVQSELDLVWQVVRRELLGAAPPRLRKY
jgi:urease accessory protein